MPRYKCTFALAGLINGATEAYVSTDTSLSVLGTDLQSLIDKRNALLPADIQWTGVRIAEVDNPRASITLPPGVWTLANGGINLTIPTNGDLPLADPKSAADQGRACIQLRCTYGKGYQVTRYLSFVPDAIINGDEGGLIFSENPAFNTAFPLFTAEIIQKQWAVRARDRSANLGPAPIVKWVGSSDAPSDVGLQVRSANLPQVTEDDFVHVSGVRRNGSDKMTYNGKYKVSALNYTLIPDSVVIYLNATSLAEPETVKLPGRVATVKYTYEPITAILAVRGGVHKRGKPLGLLRGRTLTRIKLDP